MSDTELPAADAPVPTCPKCQGAMWDNRASKRNPRAPDFKCRDKGCDGVIWPPRDATGPAAPAAPAGEDGVEGGAARSWPAPTGAPDDPACPVCGGKMWDDRTSKRNPRAPDFKCRNKPKVMNGPGCPGVIWPPRDGEQRPAAAAPAASRGGARAAAPAPRAARPAPPPPAALPPFRDAFSDDETPDQGGYDDDDLPF